MTRSVGLPASSSLRVSDCQWLQRRHLKNLKPEDSASGPQPECPSSHRERTRATTGPALACSLDLLFTATMAAHVNLKSSFPSPPMHGLSCGHFLPVGSG